MISSVVRFGSGVVADDRRHGALAGALDADDLVEIPRFHGGEALHLENREQDTEHFFLGDTARRLHRDLAADVGRQHVVEADDLARGLDHGLDVSVVEVEDHEAPALSRRNGRRG